MPGMIQPSSARPQAVMQPYQNQPELAARIAADSTFAALEQEVLHERKCQAMKWWYSYVLSDEIAGQASLPFTMTIEQGTDFKCCYLTASVFSYDAEKPSSFPIPNSGNVLAWAGRGLTVRITDTRAGRDLTSGDLPMELIATPGYGLSFIKPFPFHYFFLRNSKIRFDVRNLDNADRKHSFSIVMHGYKYLTPGS